MGRKPREFTLAETADMVRLFNAGHSTDSVGELHDCSGNIAARVLRTRLGDLRTARAIQKARNSMAGERLKHLEYREGFELGYRMALTHVNLHGLERAREYCNGILLPWRDTGLDGVPPPWQEIRNRE